jgi:thermitase
MGYRLSCALLLKPKRGERNMKKKIASVLVLILILTNTLGTAFAIKSSSTGSQVPTKGPQDPGQSPGYDENRWNFNDTSQWGNFTYMNGNRTRLVVGVDGKNAACLAELEKIAVRHQGEIVNTVSFGGHVRAAVVELLLNSVTAFVGEVRAAALASYVEPNMKVQAQLVPNDPYWNLQWGPQKIEADWAWNTTMGNNSVLVAVVDTGIDYNHPDLAANYVSIGFNWVNNSTDPKDDFGHGTHCAGIIAAVLNNNVGIAGLAQVRIMAEKVLDSGGGGYWDWVANGILHATDMGANIISMSLGGYGDSELLHDAVKYAYAHGVLVIAAAGNDNTNVKSYPAAYDEVVAVAATDESDGKAGFSNWGDWIELAAPGVNIYSTMPTYPVTLNYMYGYAMNYDFLSGTSMACPHVSGEAALLWSRYPNRTRDWVRLWLRYTADDLGDPGFDVYYGYGRVNARKTVEQAPPAHELIAYGLVTPPYVEPGTSGTINASVLNFGENDETGVTVQLLSNDTIVNSTSLDLVSSNSTTVSLTWTPTVEGGYNVTFYVVPVPGEINLENNALSEEVYVGFPVKAFVMRSAGNVYGDIITNWQALNGQWYLFGDSMVYIDYSTLNEQDITYADIAATGADVLIISCAYDPYAGWQFSDSEIEAITQYVHEGHGLIATAGTFYSAVPNNNKLAPLFGIHDTIQWGETGTDLLHLLNTTHPIFAKVPDPLVFPQVGTALPSDGRWSSNELAGGKYLGLGHHQESAIVTYRGLVYISPWLEIIPPYYHHHLQLLYNAIVWSRYQKPQHELMVSLDSPARLNPGESTLLNATVSNQGSSNENNVELSLFINTALVGDVTIPQLSIGSSYTLSYPFTSTVEGTYNITAYAPPIPGEESAENNIARKTLGVFRIAVNNVLVYSDDYVVGTTSRYVIVALDDLGINYTYYADDPGGFSAALQSQTWDLVVVDHCNYFSLTDSWPLLDTYVQNGGLLVLSTFDVDNPANLWSTLGVRSVSDMQQPEPVYRWVPSSPIFTSPNAIGDLTSYEEGYLDDGDHVAATSGTSIAGFTSSPVADSAGIVLGNTYRTVLFSFILDEFRSDQNGDGRLDAVELWENAIAYLARGYEHELAVNLAVPTFMQLGASAMLNATVRNKGANSETNVELELLVNDAILDSVNIPELSVDESYTLNFVWTPTLEGTYNVTAYTVPVSGEEDLANNVKSVDVSVMTFPDILVVADDDASYKIRGTSLPQFESSLAAAGYGYMVWNESTDGRPSLELLKVFKLVIWTCGDYWNRAVDATDAATLELYLAQGGCILLEGEDIGYDHHSDDLMVNVAHAIYGIDNTGAPGLTVTDTTHPVTIGLPSSFLWLVNPIYPDGVTPTNGGFEVICYTDTNWTAVTVFDGKAAHTGSVVYYSFPLNCLGQPETDTLVADSVGWLLPKQHDLAVTLEAPLSLGVNASTVLKATVYNTGLSDESSLNLYLLINDNVVTSATIPGLQVGDSYTLVYTWTPTTIGYYNVTAYAPPVTGEEYVVNNNVTKGVNVISPVDVAVTDVLVSSNAVYQGWVMGINVTVANLGDETETFTVSLYYDYNMIATQPVQDLAPNASITLSFAWNTTDVPLGYEGTISAEIPPLPFETNVTNNILTDGTIKIKIFGDINGDGVVNLQDLVLLAQAYGSHVGDPNYNPEADFSNDGIIGLVDLVTCAIHYGQSLPP